MNDIPSYTNITTQKRNDQYIKKEIQKKFEDIYLNILKNFKDSDKYFKKLQEDSIRERKKFKKQYYEEKYKI